MNKKRAFTLIELLAVIVILAVIALISTPIVLNIINKSKKSAFTDTAYGIIESARLYYTEQILDGGIPANKEFKFDESNNELSFNGTKPKGGSLILTSTGEITLAIHNNVWCATKAYNESKVTLKKYEESTCVIPDDIKVPDTPVTPEKTGVSIEEKMNESSEVMSIDPDHNKRYVGSNPSNYVRFNNELWRVIGVFNGEAKIIRNDIYGTSKVWNSKETNDWSTASLQEELNGTYLSEIESESRNMINDTHVWHLGGIPNKNLNWTRENVYNFEKGTDVPTGNQTTWTGGVGLMYASDYGYSTSATNSECDTSMRNWGGEEPISNCYNNSWLYYPDRSFWTLSIYDSQKIVRLAIGGTSHMEANNVQAVKPTLYLKSNVKIIDGNGTAASPFELSI